MKCGHEAWEESHRSRKCADCGEWLEPTNKPSSDFQVGDRVSVEGVILPNSSRAVRVQTTDGVIFTAHPDSLTLVERPKRKLRVGSVWECVGRKRYVHIGKDMLTDWLCTDPPVHRSLTTIDERPDLWREVPVEELEREAQA